MANKDKNDMQDNPFAALEALLAQQQNDDDCRSANTSNKRRYNSNGVPVVRVRSIVGSRPKHWSDPTTNSRASSNGVPPPAAAALAQVLDGHGPSSNPSSSSTPRTASSNKAAATTIHNRWMEVTSRHPTNTSSFAPTFLVQQDDNDQIQEEPNTGFDNTPSPLVNQQSKRRRRRHHHRRSSMGQQGSFIQKLESLRETDHGHWMRWKSGISRQQSSPQPCPRQQILDVQLVKCSSSNNRVLTSLLHVTLGYITTTTTTTTTTTSTNDHCNAAEPSGLAWIYYYGSTAPVSSSMRIFNPIVLDYKSNDSNDNPRVQWIVLATKWL